MTLQKRSLRIGRWLVLIVGIVVGLVALLAQPWNIETLRSQPRPAQNYAEALERIEKLRVQETAPLNPVCHLQFMTHDQAVERAIVLVHGYTSCPQQFHTLGQQFYALGYNVLIAPLPHHGLADRMNDAHGSLVAEELVTYADEVVDIAQGLGSHVTMLGFSMGGATAAWAAQYRQDIDLAVVIAPAIGFKPIPTALTPLVMNVVTLLPDAYAWWDPERQDSGDPSHAYPRYSRRALSQSLRLGFAAQADAERVPPQAQKIIVVTNDNEPSVNNEAAANLVASWREHGADVTAYAFPAELKLGHDLIDPSQADQRIEIVYPQLIKLIHQ